MQRGRMGSEETIMAKPALILHGGAGARRERNYDAEVANMREVVEAMKARLDAGASALDAAVEAVVMLEDSGLYVAGPGRQPDGRRDRQSRGRRRPAGIPQPGRRRPRGDGSHAPRHAGRERRRPLRRRTGPDARGGPRRLVHRRRQGRGQPPAQHVEPRHRRLLRAGQPGPPGRRHLDGGRVRQDAGPRRRHSHSRRRNLGRRARRRLLHRPGRIFHPRRRRRPHGLRRRRRSVAGRGLSERDRPHRRPGRRRRPD
uniref:Isoaspartyl peptidase/L-asparaginase n=1 Tax=Parastrongyloides trichosuri TaxID=131310 RepID=A0A0N5A2D7_PARTI